MADENSIEKRVSEIIVNQLNVNEEQITPEASFLDDLGADSLDTVELIMAFEEEFKDEIQGEIPESDAEKLQTVGNVISYIKDKAEPSPLNPFFWHSGNAWALLHSRDAFYDWAGGKPTCSGYRLGGDNAARARRRFLFSGSS